MISEYVASIVMSPLGGNKSKKQSTLSIPRKANGTESMEPRLWSSWVLLCAVLSFPIVLLVALVLYVFNLGRRAIETASGAEDVPKPRGDEKTAIVSGGKMTKALVVARHLKAQGWRVVMLETHKYWMVASRFSKSVDRFVTVPVPEQQPEAYYEALMQLAIDEDASLFVPVSSPVASVYDARASEYLPPTCRSLALSHKVCVALDDKVTFTRMALDAGLSAPDTQRMASKADIVRFNAELAAQHAASPTQLPRYILKNLCYDSMHRLDLFTLPCAPCALDEYLSDPTINVTEETPWGVQTFIQGSEYSSCAVAHQGKLVLFTANHASISCFNYEHCADPRLHEWVSSFCAAHAVTGVVCIDFIIDDATKIPYAIECNPRWSSNITNFHTSRTMGRALIDPAGCVARGECELPKSDAVETNWLAVDLYYALQKPNLSPAQRLRAMYKAVFENKDAYWERDDLLPFLALHFVHIPTLLLRNIWRGNKWAKIDMCIGKLTEVNGD